MLEKSSPRRSLEYMKWIRTNPCVITSKVPIAHHVTVHANRGIGQKPSDYWCLPLDYWLHNNLHHVGERTFWDFHNMDPHLLIAEHLEKYLKTRLDKNARLELQELYDRNLI